MDVFLSLVFPPQLKHIQAIYHSLEDEGVAEVELMRIGPSMMIDRDEAVVYWATADGSARAGEKYHATSGKCVFPRGETYSAIKVDLINDSNWDPTLDFSIVLQEEGVQNLELHRYLR